MEQGTNYARNGSSEYIRNVGTLVPVYTTTGVTLFKGGGNLQFLSTFVNSILRVPQNADFSFFFLTLNHSNNRFDVSTSNVSFLWGSQPQKT